MLDNFFDMLARNSIGVEKSQDPFSDEFFDSLDKQLKERISDKRYKHTMGVVEMAEKLAKTYDVDIKKARLAALLHDWDKCYNETEIRERIDDLGLKSEIPGEVYEGFPKLAHGVTASLALSHEHPEIPCDVLRAVAIHSTGGVHVNGLDMVIYIADALDPSREYPEYDELAKKIGKVSLHELYVEVMKYCIIAVLKKDKPIHPLTLEIWNRHILKFKEEK